MSKSKQKTANIPPIHNAKLAENLASLIHSHHTSVEKLARSLDMPATTLRRLLDGRTADPRLSTLQLLANYFNITVDELAFNADYEKPSRQAHQSSIDCVPIIGWDIINSLSTIQEIDTSIWQDWQPVLSYKNHPIGKRCFAIKSRPSMSPRFPKGTLFIFDEEKKPKDGDLVLVRFKENHEVSIRELIIDPPEWQLHSIYQGVNMIPYQIDSMSIIAVSILILFYIDHDNA